MKSLALITGFLCLSFNQILAQSPITGSFKVGGEITKFYPVTFLDGGWDFNVPTELKLGRSNIHQDSAGNWRGSLMAYFKYHVYQNGHGAHFIDAFIRQSNNNYPNFVSNYRDATVGNASKRIVVYLRGNSSYYYQSNYAVSPIVYDSTTFVEQVQGGTVTHTPVDTIATHFTGSGYNVPLPVYWQTTSVNFINGTLGIGTKSLGDNRLAVNGTISAKKVKVTATGWPDYVFEEDYALMPPDELAAYIRANKHLPEVPAADSIHRAGLDLGEMNKVLMKKVEELTLYMLQQQEQLKAQARQLERLEKIVKAKE